MDQQDSPDPKGRRGRPQRQGRPGPEPLPPPEAPLEDHEVEEARELLDRTVQFLSHCMLDPEGAMKSEDPRELIRGLRELSVEKPAPTAQPASEPRTIPIRRRRSA